MKFGKKLTRVEHSFNAITGLQLGFISYKNLKKLLKTTLEKFQMFQTLQQNQDSGISAQEAENLYLESAERFMGVLCQDILEIAWVYDSHIKTCTNEQRFYLQAYAFLNTEAVRKICKKFDKHVVGEDILASMMKKLRTQNFFADIQSLGPYEVGALRRLLVGEGFEGETLPWLSTGSWVHGGTDLDFYNASVFNEEWKVKRAQDLATQQLDENEEDDSECDSEHGLDQGHDMESPGLHEQPPQAFQSQFVPQNPYEQDFGVVVPPFQANQLHPQQQFHPQQQYHSQVQQQFHPQVQQYQLHQVPQFQAGAEQRQQRDVSHNDPENRWTSPPRQDFNRRDPTKRNNYNNRNRTPQYQEQQGQTNQRDDGQIGNLIVNYLPNEWSEIELLALFSKFGEILSARVIRERHSRKSKGFGFVKFTTDAAAESAIKGLNGEIAHGKRIKVAFAKPRQSRAKANLFVSRFPSDWTSVALKKLFSPFGDIVECRVLRTIAGESKRCGFVRFSTEEDALRAIIALNSSVLPGEKARLRVKVADRERYQQMKRNREREFFH